MMSGIAFVILLGIVMSFRAWAIEESYEKQQAENKVKKPWEPDKNLGRRDNQSQEEYKEYLQKKHRREK